MLTELNPRSSNFCFQQRRLRHRPYPPVQALLNVCTTVAQLSRFKIGSILVFPRHQRVERCPNKASTTGHQVLCGTISDLCVDKVIREMHPVIGPYHDGAIVFGAAGEPVTHGRLITARSRKKASGAARHTAARNLCKMCDCMVVVVSEEKGGCVTLFWSDLKRRTAGCGQSVEVHEEVLGTASADNLSLLKNAVWEVLCAQLQDWIFDSVPNEEDKRTEPGYELTLEDGLGVHRKDVLWACYTKTGDVSIPKEEIDFVLTEPKVKCHPDLRSFFTFLHATNAFCSCPARTCIYRHSAFARSLRENGSLLRERTVQHQKWQSPPLSRLFEALVLLRL